MSAPQVKVSLIVPTYSPGDIIDGLIDSLEAQTMPADEFEVIFVDDGSPDDTCSGSTASRTPRNVVLERSRTPAGRAGRAMSGSSWPAASTCCSWTTTTSCTRTRLEAAYAMVARTGADVSMEGDAHRPVEVGRLEVYTENGDNVVDRTEIHPLIPTQPAQAFRRELLMQHGIRFPEGRRVLWEDWYINVGAFRHAKKVAVLADTPVYLWHVGDANTSHSCSTRVDFWDRLDEMMEYVDATLDEDEFHKDHLVLMEHNVRNRVINRCVRLLANDDIDDPAEKEHALKRSVHLLKRFCSDEVFAALPKKQQGLAVLLQQQRADLAVAYDRGDAALDSVTRVTDVNWDNGALQLDVVTSWHAKNPTMTEFDLSSGRVLRVVDPQVRAALPPELLDYTDDLDRQRVAFAVRSREGHFSWQLPYQGEPRGSDGGVDRAVAPQVGAGDP